MNCDMTLLSPLHIGNGNELKMVDFYFDEDQKLIRLIDFEKFIDDCLKKGIDLSKEMHDRQYYRGKDFSITMFMDNKSIDPEEFTSYTVDAKISKKERETEFAVKEFIKSNGPYLPGSSIKGAIKTAMMWKYLKDIPEGKTIVSEKLKSRSKKIGDEISKAVFGRDSLSDIFRALKITDTDREDTNKLEISEIKIVGNSEDIPVYVENLKTGTKLNFEASFDSYVLESNEINGFKNHHLYKYMNIKEICKACNEFSDAIIEKHRQYLWNKYGCEGTAHVFDQLHENVLKCGENEAILHIGWGGGWYSTTIGLILETFPEFPVPLDEYPENWNLSKDTIRYKLRLGIKPGGSKYTRIFPKTRRLTIEDKPLGWVKICFKP